MEFKIGTKVFVVNKATFFKDIEEGKFIEAKLVTIRCKLGDGVFSDSSYVCTSKPAYPIILIAKDNEGNLYSAGAESTEGFDYEFISTKYLKKFVRARRNDALERYIRLDKLSESVEAMEDEDECGLKF